MTREEFERLDEVQAERWMAHRYRQFLDQGFPPDLSLLFAVHPEVVVASNDARDQGCLIDAA